MRGKLRIWGPILMAALAAGPAISQDRLAGLRSRFQHESDPVRKAKLMPDLGDAEFREIQRDAADGRLPEALAALREYRDEAESCVKALDATQISAEKHSSGFKQLQISLQESLRRLNTLLPTIAESEQAAFVEVRKDLDDMDRHLIEELFPRRPAPQAAPPKSTPQEH